MTITSSNCVEGAVSLLPPAPEFLSALLWVFRLRDFLTTLSSSESNKSSTSLSEGAKEPLDALFRFVFFAFDPVDRSLSASSSDSTVITSPEEEAVEAAIDGAGAAAVDGREPELPALLTG